MPSLHCSRWRSENIARRFSPDRNDMSVQPDLAISGNQAAPVMTNSGHDHLICQITMKGQGKLTAFNENFAGQFGHQKSGRRER